MEQSAMPYAERAGNVAAAEALPPTQCAAAELARLQATFDGMQAAARFSSEVSLATRLDRLKRLQKMISDNDGRIIAAIDTDFGTRMPDETRLLEIVPLMNALRHTRRHLRSWMKPERRPISIIFQPASGAVVPQPLGTVGIVAPWNYPLYLSLGPLIDAMAAGNRAMIKPSEIGRAARSIAFGKFLNAGQTCVAPDHVWVPRAQLDAFLVALEDHIRTSYPAFPEGSTSMASTRHFERQLSLLADLPAGHRVLCIGMDDVGARKIAPRLVVDPPADSLVMREEIFGPILPVLSYDDLTDVLAAINSGARPLALYCFSRTRKTADRILRATVSGGMTINGTILHLGQDELPFGGVGASGIGAYHGHQGFKRFSHMKSVFRIGPVNTFEPLGPPWGFLARQIYRLLGR